MAVATAEDVFSAKHPRSRLRILRWLTLTMEAAHQRPLTPSDRRARATAALTLHSVAKKALVVTQPRLQLRSQKVMTSVKRSGSRTSASSKPSASGVEKSPDAQEGAENKQVDADKMVEDKLTEAFEQQRQQEQASKQDEAKYPSLPTAA